jgi:hypothetical protein
VREWTETVLYLRELGLEPPAPPPEPEQKPLSPLGRLGQYFSAFGNRPAK